MIALFLLLAVKLLIFSLLILLFLSFLSKNINNEIIKRIITVKILMLLFLANIACFQVSLLLADWAVWLVIEEQYQQ